MPVANYAYDCVELSKTVQFPSPAQVDIHRMLLKRFYVLEHEHRQLAARIIKAVGVKEAARLLQRRMAIVTEAREILNQMNVPEPHWCSN